MPLTNVPRLAVLAIVGLSLFVGLLTLAINVSGEAFQAPGVPLLRPETLRTAETPFRGSLLSQVFIIVIVAMVAIALGAAVVVL